ncbi:DUF1273 domain-containing protein [Peribacillus loiseleuriae]|uniref:DUF1273 domain-containing protein n=1 Tax=Peribacillus loiseleuriae TaxID=1679170 RepID=UPI00380DEF0F
MKVLYITGYKAYEYGIFKKDHQGIKYIKKVLKQRLLSFIDEGLEWVIISGQLGTELWAAEVVFECQQEYAVKLAVITPYLNQEESWNEENREFYQSIIAKADLVESIYKSPYEGPSQLKMKNVFMVRKSDGMMIIYDEEKEGSPKFAMAEAKKYRLDYDYSIFPITFDDLEQMATEEQWSDECL